MDPIFIALLAKFGVETIIEIIQSWRASGEPTPEQIREAFINLKPEDFFRG